MTHYNLLGIINMSPRAYDTEGNNPVILSIITKVNNKINGMKTLYKCKCEIYVLSNVWNIFSNKQNSYFHTLLWHANVMHIYVYVEIDIIDRW